MRAATLSKAFTLGVIISLLALLLVGPALAQGAPENPYLQLLEQYRQMYGGAAASAPPELLPETGAAPVSLVPEGASSLQLPERMVGPQAAPAPEQLPATGEQPDPYLQLLEYYRQLHGGD